ncbi:MAG: DUF438 domain-containing protein [Promethearchaeota archaeon]
MSKGSKKDVSKKELIKELILALHNGGDIKTLRTKFKEEFGDISPLEISTIEQELMDSGELTPDQVVKLCDLHVALYQDALDDHRPPEEIPGHPVNTYMKENDYARKLIEKLRKEYSEEGIKELSKIIIHYTRLQNQLFPELERAGFGGPSQVMWSKQDEIKEAFKSVNKDNYKDLLDKIEEQILKEEKVLYPTALEILGTVEWSRVRLGEEEIGYAWVKPGNEWAPVTPEMIHKNEIKKPGSEQNKQDQYNKAPNKKEKTLLKENNKLNAQKSKVGENSMANNENVNRGTPGVLVDLLLETGRIPADLIDVILKTIPGDITIINENDEVIYYSNTDHRIFPRSPNIIGRKVQKCHPPKSVHVVEKIIAAFREGRKDLAEFWIQLNGKFILIKYYALRDKSGKYRGVMEFSQELSRERALEGEQRLLSWEDN